MYWVSNIKILFISNRRREKPYAIDGMLGR